MYTGLPEVTVTPLSQTVEITHSAKLVANVKGVGVKNFRYKWIHKGIVLSNENTRMLVIHSVQQGNTGRYHCHISNMYNDTDRSTAVLNVRSM